MQSSIVTRVYSEKSEPNNNLPRQAQLSSYAPTFSQAEYVSEWSYLYVNKNETRKPV